MLLAFMASTASELIWIKQLLEELNFKTHKPMKMFCDNNAARHIASNAVYHERTKHIEIDCHFVREKIQAKVIETPYVRSQDQLADIFTKGLIPKAFKELVSKLGLIDIYNPSLRGSIENKSP
jgi:hypothetical protein